MTGESLVRADLLLALENAGAVTPTELRLSGSLSLERYEALGAMLGQLGSSVRWWLGDWLAFGEQHFGEVAAQLSEALNLSAEGRQEYLRVALAIPAAARRPGLSWSHHRRVAARWVTPELRDRLLDAAERDGLSSNELQAHAEVVRAQLPPGEVSEVRRAPRPGRSVSRARSDSRSRPASVSECEELADEYLAELHAALLDCGFADGLRVTVEVSAASVAYRVSLGPEEAAA